MQYPSYPAFRTAFLTMMDGDDVSQSSIATSTLDQIIAAGEQRIYRDIRSSVQDVALTLTVTGNAAPLPADLLELKSVYFPTFAAVIYAPYEAVQSMIQLGGNQSTQHPCYYAQQGESLIFFPAQADGTVISGRYIKRFPDISTGLTGNLFFARYPDVFLYAALAESGPFIGEQSRLPEWKERYLTLAQAANEFERRRTTRGSKLATRRA